MSSVEQWVDRFAKLRKGNRYGVIRPHKPVLLLAVIDLIDEGTITSPRIQLTPELVEAFRDNWSAAFPDEKPGLPQLPFFHLRGDRFWKLIAAPGEERTLAAIDRAPSIRRLREIVVGAELDQDLWELLQQPKPRSELRRAIFAAHFDPRERQSLIASDLERRKVAQYRQALLKRSSQPFQVEGEEPPALNEKTRSAAFRSAIQRLYDHTCAFCGFRIITPTGATALEAAHIVPFSMSRNDDPRNGLGLCVLHHWAFDEGLLTCQFKNDLTIVVSPLLDSRRPTEDILCKLDKRKLLLPRDRKFHPAAEAIDWHRENRLLKDQ